mmetsp:Transcript_14592/g.28735  ORF Transcript_14592/g.28735 Transcript_14592/m.28735 type:complete len:228 (+) Transcript_14592:53-736(+)|eukprot:CAMPEP_0172870776 /NCGR_PEP_ID=MMETSP1075-20121228/91713_1 /TAXON_ID=2916 /ORGANISM="Ceratium fusus, Strain PA161109" /LENGTH=227 /DNA_ID=CAMNT_0013720943 /DNA_START=52 /DNA_END=735 /DNA_ORIENTATION=+
MVIPLPAGLNQLNGPPPPELNHRFYILKHVVLALLLSLVLNLVVGVMTDFLSALRGSLNLIFLCLTGIFLMNEDEHLKPAYNFMMTTCCHGCQEQCQGGMSCLMWFGVMCFFTLVMEVLAGEFTSIYRQSTAILTGKTNNPLLVIHVLSVVISVIARGVGSWCCWKAYGEARQIQVGMEGGGWAEDGRQQPYSGAGSAWGGGAPPEEGQQLQGFNAFQGSGNRLGGE